MRPDLIDLQAFYGSRQGQLVRRLLNREIRALWPDLTGQRVLGIGYAAPFLGALAGEVERLGILMSPEQGAMRWPNDRRNQVALAAEDDLPIADHSVDRVLLIHALEATGQIQRLLREIWRILADGGQMLVVVPNRRGLWCLSEQTPFGQGRPFSPTQLKQLLRSNLFAPQHTTSALFVPPSSSNLLLRTAFAWERMGLRFAPRFGGVILSLAEKQIYAMPLQPAKAKRRLPAYLPAARPAAAVRVAARCQISVGQRGQAASG
jgi:SAM-dependent methyltransferase